MVLIVVLFIKIYLGPLLFGVIPELRQTIYLCSLPNKLQVVQEENSGLTSALEKNRQPGSTDSLQAEICSLLSGYNCLLLSEKTVPQTDPKRSAPELVLEYRFAGIYPNVARAITGLHALKYPLCLEAIQLTPDRSGTKIEAHCRLVTLMPKEPVI